MKLQMSHRARWRKLVPAIAVAGMLSATGGVMSAGASATPQKAKSTITIGVGDLTIPGVYDTSVLWGPGTNAALAYINAHGGWGGHPVVVNRCGAAQDPASELLCYRQWSAAGVMAYTGLLYNNASEGIPLMSQIHAQGFNVPAQAPELVSPWESSATPGTVGEYTAAARYLCSKGYKSVAVIQSQNAAVLQSYNFFASGLYAACGISVNVVAVPSFGVADFSPYVQKAISTNPQAIYVAPSGTQSGTAILDKFATAGYPTSQMIFNFSLVTPAFRADPNSNGVTVAAYSLNGIPGTTRNSLWSQYIKYMGITDPTATPTQVTSAVSGFQQMMTIWEAMKSAGFKNLTATSLHKYMASGAAAGHMQIPLQRVAVKTPGFPGVMAPYMIYIKLDSSGNGKIIGYPFGYSICRGPGTCAKGILKP
jgi:ABC-type branched-subunit amino acid transport system substrate-binding protein